MATKTAPERKTIRRKKTAVKSISKVRGDKEKKESPTGGKIHNNMIVGRITYYTDEQELFE